MVIIPEVMKLNKFPCELEVVLFLSDARPRLVAANVQASPASAADSGTVKPLISQIAMDFVAAMKPVWTFPQN